MFTGVPFPPTKLAITADTCQNRTTTLSWVTSASIDEPILHFLVEQESNHEPGVFKLIYTVPNPNATSVTLHLSGWATLCFRLRAVNILGPSRPSEATGAGICRTSEGSKFSMLGFNSMLVVTLTRNICTGNVHVTLHRSVISWLNGSHFYHRTKIIFILL